MDFSESFSVDAALKDVWDLMTDVERIAPCLPGAQLQEIDGEDYHGIVKVKVGPITSQYKGIARFEQVDEAEHKIVLTAQGRDTKGAGNASAKIGVSLEDDATGDSPATQVMVDVHLDLKGKVAQFGRGVLADVSGKLMAKFAENLSEMIAAGQAEADEVEAVDLLEVTGSRRVKAGIAVVGAALLAAVLFIRRLFRRKKAG